MPTVIPFATYGGSSIKNGRSSESRQARLDGRVVTDEGEANQEAGESTNETTKKEIIDMKGKKVLVAYFSWSGNTREAAQYIAQKTGADEFEIIREKAYPTEYTTCTEDAKAEKEAGERPAIKGKVENMAQYDVVFVCVPVWCCMVVHGSDARLHILRAVRPKWQDSHPLLHGLQWSVIDTARHREGHT